MKQVFSGIIIIAALLVVVGTATANPTSAAIENWVYNYPDAAYELRSWSKENPRTAQKIATWYKSKHDQPLTLASWATTNSGSSIDQFMKEHANWSNLEDLMKNHRPATRELFAWCRQYPGAARSLIKLSRK
jgi:hypothetical protein